MTSTSRARWIGAIGLVLLASAACNGTGGVRNIGGCPDRTSAVGCRRSAGNRCRCPAQCRHRLHHAFRWHGELQYSDRRQTQWNDNNVHRRR